MLTKTDMLFTHPEPAADRHCLPEVATLVLDERYRDEYLSVSQHA
ncbi:MAG TPA: hypothetical protein VHZ03_54485 [Trebonia sp.]|nr:hypothetical protein [Trebonia sp.]